MAASLSTAESKNLLQFLKLVGQLKRVPRTGWVYRKVKQPESVSDHMYRMSIMAMTITDPKVNKERCMKIALVHDMAESIVGDIAPMDKVSKEEKHRREKEYESQSSPEARLVKDFDLAEMILQAQEYEELEETPGRLQEFFDSTEGRFHHPDVIQLVDCLKEERRGHMSKVAEPPTHTS
ncbi:HD domain-containing protein 2 isoform X2 [Gadus macrocephalus]|uniref:HD domain-containing protein 2 isoform X2 n=1 Tax=Gadus macrocephalus TaxID=80720 RepID=UPI0028CB2176|nr:HD domain-containing protein 2 isoform X2 [Gadus macrocephalus]